MVIWITGLSGSGKTTLAKIIYQTIKTKYKNVILLDGDIIRNALGNSYGYTLSERLKGAKQIHGLCKMLDNEDMIVICATMSLFKEIHKKNKNSFKSYLEIFLDVDMKVLIQRDKKSLYSRALDGLEDNVVGVNLSYDKPDNANLYLNNNLLSNLDENIKIILNILKEKYNIG
jgi:adenylylsulfate kinase-like enzyme